MLEELPIPADAGPAAAPLLALRARAELGLARTEDARKAAAPDAYERGLRLLQQALSKAPDSGETHYHLAAAYAKAGDAARARSELERLLKSGVAFPQEPDARAAQAAARRSALIPGPWSPR